MIDWFDMEELLEKEIHRAWVDRTQDGLEKHERAAVRVMIVLEGLGLVARPEWNTKRRGCSVEDCDESHYALGFCLKHWNQQRRAKQKSG